MLTDRFWKKVSPEPNSGCWLWQAATNQFDYGVFWLNGKNVAAHRASYEDHIGPIPDGLVLDHKCRVPCCVNPDHLEPVTQKENVRRGDFPKVAGIYQRNKTHCPSRHEYDGKNTYYDSNGYRLCRACSREKARKKKV